MSVGFRRLGLVLGILIVGPLTWWGLTDAVRPAAAVAVAGVLEARVPLSEKTSLAIAVARGFRTVNAGETPDLEAIAASLSPESQEVLIAAVTDRVQPVFTRALRWPFIAGAVLALLTIVPFLLLGRARREVDTGSAASRVPHNGRAWAGAALIAAALAGGVALLAWEFSAGAASFGEGGTGRRARASAARRSRARDSKPRNGRSKTPSTRQHADSATHPQSSSSR